MERFGTVKINLAKLIDENGISKNKLSQRAEMQRSQTGDLEWADSVTVKSKAELLHTVDQSAVKYYD